MTLNDTGQQSEKCLDVVERFYANTSYTRYEVNTATVVAVNFVMAPPTIVLNLLVIIIVLKYKNLQVTCNILLCGLAISDLLNGMLLQTSFIAIHIMALQRVIECGYYIFVAGIAFTVLYMSMGGLMLITTDRYLAIFHPYWYAKRAIDNTMAVKVILCNCVLSALLGICSMYSKNYILFNILFPTIAGLLMPWSVYVHRKALKTIRRIRAVEDQKGPEGKNERAKAVDRRSSRIALFVILAMAICYGPEAVLNILEQLALGDTNNDFKSARSWATTLMNANSLINPLIYCWQMRAFRSAIRSLLKKEGNDTNTTQTFSSTE